MTSEIWLRRFRNKVLTCGRPSALFDYMARNVLDRAYSRIGAWSGDHRSIPWSSPLYAQGTIHGSQIPLFNKRLVLFVLSSRIAWQICKTSNTMG